MLTPASVFHYIVLYFQSVSAGTRIPSSYSRNYVSALGRCRHHLQPGRPGRGETVNRGSGKACGIRIDKCMYRVCCGWFALSEYGWSADAGGSVEYSLSSWLRHRSGPRVRHDRSTAFNHLWNCAHAAPYLALISRFYYPNVTTLRSVFAIANPSVVCLSSVTFVPIVRPTQGVDTFGNISSSFCTLAILWPPCKILRRSS